MELILIIPDSFPERLYQTKSHQRYCLALRAVAKCWTCISEFLEKHISFFSLNYMEYNEFE